MQRISHCAALALLGVGLCLLGAGLAGAQDEGGDAPAWAAEVEALLDIDNFDAPPDRVEAARKIVASRLEAEPGDREARLTYAKLLVPDQPETAIAEAEKIAAAEDASEQSKLEAGAVRVLATERVLKDRLEALDSDEARREALPAARAEFGKVFEAFIEQAGGRQEAIKHARALHLFLSTLEELGVVGQPPRPIAKPDLEGEMIELDDYEGKVVLIDFWATWCGPCVHEMPNVKALYERLHERGFEVIGISLDSNRGRLESYLEENGIPWRQYFDGKKWQNEVSRAWGINSIPATYLIDRDGIVRYVGLRGEQLAEKVELLLERPASGGAAEAKAGEKAEEKAEE